MSTYRDLSTYYGELEGVGITCTDDDAILNGFINLVNTLKDSDGISERPFRPNLGSTFYSLVQDPLDDFTSFQIKRALEHLATQTTRAKFSNSTTVTPNLNQQCFDIKIVLINTATGNTITGFFNLSSLN